MFGWKIPIIAVLIGAASGCAQRVHYLELSGYPAFPMPASTRIMRKSFEVDPVLRNVAVYGNYGGPGNWGGEPIDSLDACFYRHDLAYSTHDRLDELLEADRALIADLRNLDLDTLDTDARRFRKRSLFFMRTPFAFFSKPGNVWFGLPPTERVVIVDR